VSSPSCRKGTKHRAACPLATSRRGGAAAHVQQFWQVSGPAYGLQPAVAVRLCELEVKVDVAARRRRCNGAGSWQTAGLMIADLCCSSLLWRLALDLRRPASAASAIHVHAEARCEPLAGRPRGQAARGPSRPESQHGRGGDSAARHAKCGPGMQRLTERTVQYQGEHGDRAARAMLTLIASALSLNVVCLLPGSVSLSPPRSGLASPVRVRSSPSCKLEDSLAACGHRCTGEVAGVAERSCRLHRPQAPQSCRLAGAAHTVCCGTHVVARVARGTLQVLLVDEYNYNYCRDS
jgi:hypothetical protein